MARSRTIKPHFLHSSSMRKVSLGAELTFVRLWLLADDAGRVEDSPKPHVLPTKLYPGRDDVHGEVAGWLEELERVGCIVGYRVKDRPYLRVVNWRKHQRISHPTPSRLPSEADGVREPLKSRSRTTREAVAKIAESGPSSRQRTVVVAESAAPHEALVKIAVEAPNGGHPRPFHERLMRLFSISPAS